MVIPRFVKAAVAGEPITIYGDGKQSRCFGYVMDVIDGITSLTNDPGSYGQVFNIGATEEITIEDLALKIKSLASSSSEIKYLPYEEAYGEGFDDMRRRIPSLDKIEKQVGYRPKTSLDQILEKIIAYFRR
jgi:UDP-glucose 4-epimerase